MFYLATPSAVPANVENPLKITNI